MSLYLRGEIDRPYYSLRCMCGWLGSEQSTEERFTKGDPPWSYYGGSPDSCELVCPDCGAVEAFEEVSCLRRVARVKGSIKHAIQWSWEAA